MLKGCYATIERMRDQRAVRDDLVDQALRSHERSHCARANSASYDLRASAMILAKAAWACSVGLIVFSRRTGFSAWERLYNHWLPSVNNR